MSTERLYNVHIGNTFEKSGDMSYAMKGKDKEPKPICSTNFVHVQNSQLPPKPQMICVCKWIPVKILGIVSFYQRSTAL